MDGLKAYAESEVSDAQFADRAARFPVNPPQNKEYYMLRSIFESQYPGPSALATIPIGKSIACSTPEALSWDPKWAALAGDISGRAVDVHDSASGFKADAAAGAANNSTGKKVVVAAALGCVSTARPDAVPRRAAAASHLPTFVGLRRAGARRAGAAGAVKMVFA